MKTNRTAAGSSTVLEEMPLSTAQEAMVKFPEPQREHELLTRLVGRWQVEVVMRPDPAKPPVKSSGVETVRMLGGFWSISEFSGTFMDRPFSGVFTLGYDPEMQRYVGTWVDSVSSHLWSYEGAVDSSGRTLTLNSEGPCPSSGKVMKVRETIEIQGTNQRIMRNETLGEDGRWTPGMTITYRRI